MITAFIGIKLLNRLPVSCLLVDQAFSSDLILISAAAIPALEFSTAHVDAGLTRSDMMPHISPELKHSMSAYMPSTLKHSATPPSMDAVT